MDTPRPFTPRSEPLDEEPYGDYEGGELDAAARSRSMRNRMATMKESPVPWGDAP